MDIKIKAIHFDAAEKLESFIQKKAERIARHNADITDVDVTLKVVKPETALNKNALIRVSVPQHEDILAEKTADTFEEAVDLCFDDLIQLRNTHFLISVLPTVLLIIIYQVMHMRICRLWYTFNE